MNEQGMSDSDLAIATSSLTRRFGEFLAVDNLELRVRPGEIYGFLGLNGAGKTTAIRMLLGMARPSAGSARVLGETVRPGLSRIWARVGHLVESPAAYPELTVRENLEVARRLSGVRDPGAVSRAIGRLELGAYADRRAGTLSLGNKQRLGLARVLLHQPELLVLDEPTNGLDPAGVVEVRELLRGLVRERGMTVFMSSHILAEVDRLANRIGIIHRGRLVEELDSEELEHHRRRRLLVDARDRLAARGVLEAAGYHPGAFVPGAALYLDDARAIERPEEVATALVTGGVPPTRLDIEQEDLETHFLRLTGAPAEAASVPVNSLIPPGGPVVEGVRS